MNLLLLGLNGSLIAGIYAFAKAGGLAPLRLLAWQLLFAAVVVGAVAALRGQWPRPGGAALRYAAIAGTLGISAPNLLTFSALAWVPAGVIGVIGALSPLFTYLLALLLGVERPRALRAAGIVLGLVGVLGLLLPRGALPGPGALGWALLAMGGPLLLAAGNLYRSLAWPAGLAPLGAASLMLALQAAVVVPLALLAGDFGAPRGWEDPGDRALWGAGLLTAVFYLSAFELQRRAGPVVVGQLGYVITVASLAIGAAVFGERHAPLALASIVLVLGGVMLVQRGAPAGARP